MLIAPKLCPNVYSVFCSNWRCEWAIATGERPSYCPDSLQPCFYEGISYESWHLLVSLPTWSLVFSQKSTFTVLKCVGIHARLFYSINIFLISLIFHWHLFLIALTDAGKHWSAGSVQGQHLCNFEWVNIYYFYQFVELIKERLFVVKSEKYALDPLWLNWPVIWMQDDQHARHNESNATIASEAEYGFGRQHFAQVVDPPSTPIVGMLQGTCPRATRFVHYLFG